MTTFFTDFSGYTDAADLHTNGDWQLENGDETTWTHLVDVDGGDTGGSFAFSDPGYGGNNQQEFNTTIGSVSGDCEIVARVKMASVVANEPIVMICGTATSGNGIALVYMGSGAWRLIDWRGGVYDYVSAELSSHFTPSNDTYFWVRLGRVDSSDTVRFNVGATEASVATSSWDSETASYTGYTSGYIGLMAYDCYDSGAAPQTYDIVGIGDGEEAPTSGGGGGPTGNPWNAYAQQG